MIAVASEAFLKFISSIICKKFFGANWWKKKCLSLRRFFFRMIRTKNSSLENRTLISWNFFFFLNFSTLNFATHTFQAMGKSWTLDLKIPSWTLCQLIHNKPGLAIIKFSIFHEHNDFTPLPKNTISSHTYGKKKKKSLEYKKSQTMLSLLPNYRLINLPSAIYPVSLLSPYKFQESVLLLI